MLPQPDNGVSAVMLIFIGFIQFLVVAGLIVLAYLGISRALSHAVGVWTASRRRRRGTEPGGTEPPTSDN